MKKMSSFIFKIKSKSNLKLNNLAVDLACISSQEAKSIGFMSRLLIMLNLPYRDPGNEAKVWVRKNGNVSLILTPAYNELGESIGLPYGSYPRLILAYLITQAVKTQSPIIFLGKSFRDFLKLLEISKGGKQYYQLQKQLERVLSTAFSWTFKNDQIWSRSNIQVSHEIHLWWDSKLPDQTSLWDSYIKLNTDFFNEIIRNAVPIDFRILKAFRNTPLGLDLCLFLSWRVFNLNKPVYISWPALKTQLGGQYSDVNVFSRDCRKHIKKILVLWPGLNLEFLKGQICIKPTKKYLISVDKVCE